MNYVQNIDGNILLFSTWIVLVAYISSYIYRKLRTAAHEVVDLMAEAHEVLFTCQGCNCELAEDYSLRTKGYCYLCDPNITLEELLSDKPIRKEGGHAE
jgi:hypothetical protein